MTIRHAGIAIVAMLLAACAPRLQDPGPLFATPMNPSLTNASLLTADGFELPVRHWLPTAATPRAVVVALHGFNDYSNAFAGPGAWLAEQGVAVYAYDQRGFGAAPNPGLWPGETALIADLRAMLAGARARHPDLPLYAMGESMGGAVIMAAWADQPLGVDGLILVGPAVWGRIVMAPHESGSLWIAAHTLPWMRLTGEGRNIVPSDNLEMLLALGRDPLVIKETRIDAMWGLVNLMDQALAASATFDAPALILYGARDEIVPPDATLAMLERLPPANGRRVAIYEDGYHMLLRDLQGQTVWTDIAAWIGDRTAALPSGADRVDPQAALAR